MRKVSFRLIQFRKGDDGRDLVYKGGSCYSRILIGPVLYNPKDTVRNGKKKYARILLLSDPKN